MQEVQSDARKLDVLLGLRVKTIYVSDTTKIPVEIVYGSIDEAYMERNQMKAWWVNGDVYFETPEISGMISGSNITSVAFEGMPGLMDVCGVEREPEPCTEEPKRRGRPRKDAS